jgi:hypothetical protein
VVFLDKLFNPEIKKKFLSEYPDSYSTYEFVFKHSFDVEDILEMDLYQFSLKEISKVFKRIDPSTKKAARSYGSIVSSYLSWTLREGIKTDNNPLEGLGYDWFDQFVDPKNKLYLSEKELIELEDKLVNAQDSIILRLLFEGIQGDKCNEILNIQKHHVDYKTNTINVINDVKGERQVEVSSRCIQLIKKAFAEDKYWNKNGTATNEKRLYSVLLENNYLLRSNKTKTHNEDRADYFLIYRRLSNIKDSTGYKTLTPNSIRNSGMIKIATDHYYINGEISKELLASLCEKFGYEKVKNNGYLVYPYSQLRGFINEENIQLLYGDE